MEKTEVECAYLPCVSSRLEVAPPRLVSNLAAPDNGCSKSLISQLESLLLIAPQVLR